MESLLKNLKDSSASEELLKNSEGKKIARKMLSLSELLEALPEDDKHKFNSQFGDIFKTTLNGLTHEKVPQYSSYELYVTIFVCVAVFSIFGMLIFLTRMFQPKLSISFF